MASSDWPVCDIQMGDLLSAECPDCPHMVAVHEPRTGICGVCNPERYRRPEPTRPSLFFRRKAH